MAFFQNKIQPQISFIDKVINKKLKLRINSFIQENMLSISLPVTSSECVK